MRMKMEMEKENFTNELSDEDRKAIWIKLLNEIGYKSLFDYTDEEWSPIELCLMRGAGRRHKDPVEALAAVISLKRAREAVRKWFVEKEAILNSQRQDLITEFMVRNRRDHLSPGDLKFEIEPKLDEIKNTLRYQEERQLELSKRDREFSSLYHLGYNQSDLIFDELEKAGK